MALVSGRRNEFLETPETLCPLPSKQRKKHPDRKRETGDGKTISLGADREGRHGRDCSALAQLLGILWIADRGLEDNVSLHMAQWQKWYSLIHGGDSGNHR